MPKHITLRAVHELIQKNLSTHNHHNTLWVIEENTAGFPVALLDNLSIHKLSNRQDLSQRYQADFNDFNLEQYPTTECIIFRIAKEKAINLHILESALKLESCSKLVMFGHKQEGIKSLEKQIKTLGLGYSMEKQTFDKQFFQLTVDCSQSTKLDFDNHYHHMQTINWGNFNFLSKPGLFGWKKIDVGSQLLIEALSEQIETLRLDTGALQVLDLGCGYGYLSMKAYELGISNITATDNCAAAIRACQANFNQIGLNSIVRGDDCADSMIAQKNQFDLVLCNPPFHQGFDHQTDLIERFITSARQLLSTGGQAIFVVNKFVGIEKVADKHFSECKKLKDQEGFKVLWLKC